MTLEDIIKVVRKTAPYSTCGIVDGWYYIYLYDPGNLIIGNGDSEAVAWFDAYTKINLK